MTNDYSDAYKYSQNPQQNQQDNNHNPASESAPRKNPYEPDDQDYVQLAGGGGGDGKGAPFASFLFCGHLLTVFVF